MQNMLGYIKQYGGFSLDEYPLCTVDSLILSELSYLKYDGVVSDSLTKMHHGKPGRSLHAVSLKLRLGGLASGIMGNMNDEALLLAAANSRRFGTLRLLGYENIVDESRELQFSAITFLLPGNRLFIAYRGTDNSLTGWKEDFNMSFMMPVPAQVEAAAYLNRVAASFAGDLYLGGHSKGGNLAVYAAMMAPEHVQRRIWNIYSLDGPGFRHRVFETEEYRRIGSRIIKIVPKSSVVGLLLCHHEEYIIVKSNQFGLLQHDPFSWQVRDGSFVHEMRLDDHSIFMDRTLNRWLEQLDDGSRQEFVSLLFEALAATQRRTVTEVRGEWSEAARAMRRHVRGLDREKRQFMWQLFRRLIESGSGNLCSGRRRQNRKFFKELEKMRYFLMGKE